MGTTLVAKRLRVLRVSADLTQEALGDRLGVSQNAVGAWERGENEPPAAMIVAIAALFDVSTDYLLGATDFPRGLSPDSWIVDEDAVASATDPDERWCAKIPRRMRVVDYDELRRIEATIAKRVGPGNRSAPRSRGAPDGD